MEGNSEVWKEERAKGNVQGNIDKRRQCGKKEVRKEF